MKVDSKMSFEDEDIVLSGVALGGMEPGGLALVGVEPVEVVSGGVEPGDFTPVGVVQGGVEPGGLAQGGLTLGGVLPLVPLVLAPIGVILRGVAKAGEAPN